ncbi:hypothetical protein AWB74_01913 [Caballeronia arvi]|uniref:Uncharacterized protein n=1 Tax=Caballeronia arvi TaxID=1777135 RepID=A0A158HKR0_9BURK|nr:hypothetical protein [Caballeronia arvi]SAL44975.1 hypothetical protein AWB74_01913 [Caballeronia arvi]
MAEDTDVPDNGNRERVSEPLKALAELLERSLDSAASIVMMRHAPGVCSVYLGDPSGPREELRRIGKISTSLADEMLVSTASGANRMEINGQIYRFVRTFTLVDDIAAVVFST